MEQRKFPHHLLHFPVSSLQSPISRKQLWEIELQMGRAILFDWFASLILEKPLLLFNGHPNRFIMTNDKHTMFMSAYHLNEFLVIPGKI